MNGHRDRAQPDAQGVAPGRSAHRWALRGAPHRRDQRGCFVPRAARRPQRATDRRGQGRHHVRARLPGGHLRVVRTHDQRSGARAAARTATCQLHMRKFPDGAEIVVEPWRAAAFPIIKDLMCDRQALDRIVETGGFITSQTGGAPGRQPHAGPQARRRRRRARRAVHRLRGLRGGVPNGAANLFTGAKVAHLYPPPQGQAERYRLSTPWSGRWKRISGRAPTTVSARRRARRRSRST